MARPWQNVVSMRLYFVVGDNIDIVARALRAARAQQGGRRGLHSRQTNCSLLAHPRALPQPPFSLDRVRAGAAATPTAFVHARVAAGVTAPFLRFSSAQ